MEVLSSTVFHDLLVFLMFVPMVSFLVSGIVNKVKRLLRDNDAR